MRARPYKQRDGPDPSRRLSAAGRAVKGLRRRIVFIVALIVTNGEDRNMTRTQNRFRDAADQMPAHVTRPMGAHHDEIRIECLGCLHERARDACPVCIDDLSNAAYPAAYPAVHSAGLAQVARMIESLARTGRIGISRLFSFSDIPAYEIAHVVRDYACHHQHRIGRVRQLERLFKCKARADAAVKRYQNSFVHDPFPGLSPCFSVCAQVRRSLDPHQFTRQGLRRTDHVRSSAV